MKIKKLRKIIIEKKYSWLILAVAAFLSFLFILFFYFKTVDDLNIDIKFNNNYHNQTQKFSRPLDGKLVEKDYPALKPFAIIIENHFESRPSAGLEDASIIYETVVEGDITRFLALFDYSIETKKIGPIRSIRPFFIELAQEWDPIFLHAGGSNEALDMVKKSEVFSINEISSDGIYFWRDKKRQAPHNLFTSADLIKKAVNAKKISFESNFYPWQFKNDDPEKDTLLVVKEFEVNFFRNPAYQVKYIYDEKNNSYTRYLSGKPHKTENGIILEAKNIIIQKTAYKIIDDYGRIKIFLENGGNSEVYQDGKKIEGYWEKSRGRTYFYNKSGQEINLNRGVTWVELLFN